MGKQTKKRQIDLTTGPIMKNILLFALPIVLGNMLQQLYTTVDTLVVGNYCGSTSLAAIGTSSQPVEVLLCIFLGIGSGVSILVSQRAGARDMEGMKKTVGTAVFFVYVTGLPICVIGILLTPAILHLMNVPPDTWSAAVIYTRIVFLGSVGNIGYNMNAGILRGLGDSKASLWFLVVSCATNVVLDLLFVAGFGMDVGGAAIATVISMFLSWVVSIWYILRNFPEMGFTILPRRYDRKAFRQILAIGLPLGLNNSLYSFGHMVIQTLVNTQGSDFMAGATVAGKVTGLTNLAITGMSNAATTFSGQNYGAHNYDRLRKGYLKIPLVSGFITLAAGLLLISFRMPILRFFTSNTQVLLFASRYVLVLLLSQWIYAVFNAAMNMVNGVGLIRYTTVINVLMLWAVRIPVAYLITRLFDGTYVMLCYPASFAFGAVMILLYYAFSPKWKAILNHR